MPRVRARSIWALAGVAAVLVAMPLPGCGSSTAPGAGGPNTSAVVYLTGKHGFGVASYVGGRFAAPARVGSHAKRWSRTTGNLTWIGPLRVVAARQVGAWRIFR